MTEQQAAGADEAARRDRVGAGLRDAFAALADPAVPEDLRPRWHQSLIAITGSSKHDLATAETRLERWWATYEAEVGPRPAAG
jgi:hypothetical protein